MSDPTRQAMRRIMLGEARRRRRDEPETEETPWRAVLAQDPEAYVANMPEMFRVGEIADRMIELAASITHNVRAAAFAEERVEGASLIPPTTFYHAGLLRNLSRVTSQAGLNDEVFSQNEVLQSIVDVERELSTLRDSDDRSSIKALLTPLFDHVKLQREILP